MNNHPIRLRSLDQIEANVETNLSSAQDLAIDLYEIKARGLYKQTHSSFEAYAFARFGISLSSAKRWTVHGESLAPVSLRKAIGAGQEGPRAAHSGPISQREALRQKRGLSPVQTHPEPPVIELDPEDSEEVPAPPAPAALAAAPEVASEAQAASSEQDNGDSPEATPISQPVGPGVGTVESPSDPGPAEAEDPSGSAGTGSAGSLPQRTPVVDLMENLQASLSEDETNPDEIGHVVEQWSSLSGTPIPEPVVTLDTKCPYCPYDGEIVTAHLPTCEWVAGQVYRQTGIPSSPQTFTVALMNLLSDADLDALGSTMTTNEMDTLTKAYEQIRSAHVAAQPKKPVARTRKAAPKVPAKPAATATTCDHPKVAGHPAKAKGKWKCDLCGEEVPIAAMSA